MGAGYKVGYAIGVFISKVVCMLFKTVWHGTVTASKENKYLLITYISLLLALFPSYFFFNNVSVIICVILILGILFGIAEHFKEKPGEERRRYFFAVFEEVGLLYKDGSAPCYLYEERQNVYATLFAFNSLITLNEWLKKKDILEKILNVKIIAIKQDKDDMRITQLIIELKPLPNMIEWQDIYINRRKDSLVIGHSYNGIVELNLDMHPHALICGETGSGKSNILKCLIHQSLAKNYDVVLIDFKRAVSFSEFSDYLTVCYEHEEAKKILANCVDETKKRLDLFRENNVEKLKGYNQISTKKLKRKIIFIDELAELLKIRDKTISNSLYDSLETLARISRSAGIHLIIGVQRPDSTIVNGQIKNNVPVRLCGHFVDKEPSQIVLGNDKATTLPDIRGRFIINVNGFQEVQCFYYEKQVTPIIKHENVSDKYIENKKTNLEDLDVLLEELEEYFEERENKTEQQNDCLNAKVTQQEVKKKKQDSTSKHSDKQRKENKEQDSTSKHSDKQKKENKEQVIFDFSDLKK